MTIRKKWILKTQPDRDAVKDISKKRGISLLLSSVLCARGIDTEEKIDAFLNVSKQKLGDPMTMKDMDK
ncbi:MAG: single-stranded-DNA-specific exonuclease RecJ, partial [Clostridiales bacterium]|nr:single-stranded-DNA-specific exonuclease RecJ [Clostridiales bacterium]